MWDSLTWRRLEDPEIASGMATLREDSLRFFLRLTALSYVSWHFIVLLVLTQQGLPIDAETRYWALFPIVLAGLAIASYFLPRRYFLAAGFFLATAVVSITLAVWLLASPFATILFPFLVIAAVVLLNPIAGVLVGACSLTILVVFWQLGPLAFLTVDRLAETGIEMMLAVTVSWSLGRNLVASVEWTLHSYDQALQNMQAARRHRAELVQALKQLDNAYYRLERANASLELAWKAAEAAERSKIEFVTNISHELRTPLNLIVGFSEMIVTSPESYGEALPPVYRGDLNAIYRSAQHLLALTQDVLDLARVGMGRMALAREPVDLEQIITDAGAIVREYIEAKGLDLVIEVPPQLAPIMVDRLRIRQVLLNLLTNAARFTDSGSITISAIPLNQMLSIRVRDTGRGITLDELPRVFDEFYHASEADSPRMGAFGGIGLGLPLSKRFVELHGGKMGVESTVGYGTTFWFNLPIAWVDQPTSEPIHQLLRSATTERSIERVLVLLSSERRLGSFLQHHLRSCRVVSVPDRDDAVAAAISFRAAAILADVETAQAIDGHDLPVPLIRLPLPHRDRLASALGVADYLVKPVSRGDLHLAIERLGRSVRKIVIADDDERFIRLLLRLLQAPGSPYVGRESEIFVAHNGRETLDLLEAHRPDLLLLDIGMPGLDGHAVLDGIAAAPHLSTIPVIVISAYAQDEGQLRLNGELAVLKPEGFRLEELLGAIDALLNVLQPPRGYLTMTPP